MKNNTITKLYADLTYKEKAALTFKYFTEQNEVEIDRIQSSVLVQSYILKSLNFEFIEHRDALFNLAIIYGLEYWQKFSGLGWGFLGLRSALKNENSEESAFLLKVIQKTEGQLLALDAALEKVCEENAFDAAVVRKFMGIEGIYETIGSDPVLDLEYQAKKEAGFRSMMSMGFNK